MKIGKVVVVGLAVFAVAGCESPPAEDVQKVTSNLVFGNCNIPETDICVCTDVNGTGQCGDLNGFQRYFMNLSTASGLTQFNDTITSIAVGSLARGKICADPGGSGNCGYLSAGQIIPDLGAGMGCPGHPCPTGLDFGWGCKCMNNTITSIRVDQNSFECANPLMGQVSIFEDPNYNNGMHAPSANSKDCVVVNSGQLPGYPNAFLNANINSEQGGGFGLRTDVISSIKNGPSTFVHLFADPNFKGANILITNSPAFLNALMPNLDDQTTSLSVF